jgi:hypothetical protein
VLDHQPGGLPELVGRGDVEEGRRRHRAGEPIVEIRRLGGPEQVGVRHDAPRTAVREPLLAVRGDEDGVHTVGRHHAGDRAQGRVRRAGDEAGVHRVRDPKPIERPVHGLTAHGL